jgi:hypothetical protein
MSAETVPGFNPNDSLLPDPGANSAPIHIMKGGGLVFQNGGFTPMEEETLEKYQLGTGGLLEAEISADDKTAFLQQLKAFENGSLNLSTLKKDQWAILKVIQALLEKQRNLLRKNSELNVPDASAPEEINIPEEENETPNTPRQEENIPPADNANLSNSEETALQTSASTTQTGGANVEALFEIPVALGSNTEPEADTVLDTTVGDLNTKTIGKTRKRQAGGKAKLRPFAKAKTHGKRV